jgi:nucleoside-diphosphate-sugar epimerase
MQALVTGGGGFLGGGIARALLKEGNNISVIGRGRYPHLPSSIKVFQGDIRDYDFVNKSLKDIDTIFHTAAIPGIWGPAKEFYSINVQGTENIIKACRNNLVRKLVFTSSPSVVFGNSSLEGVDESTPYPDKYLCDYPRTKAIAEKLILDANCSNLFTVAIRPHLIWGPGDPHLVPRILQKASNNKLMIVGEGKNKVDIIYIDNAVSAHLKACEALGPHGNVAGKVYFVSDGKPIILWEWIANLLNRMGRPNVSRKISYDTAAKLGAILEGIYGILRIKSEPPMTRFLASQLATSHYFNISRAKKDFGYQPLISHEEGMNRLIRALKPSQQEY